MDVSSPLSGLTLRYRSPVAPLDRPGQRGASTRGNVVALDPVTFVQVLGGVVAAVAVVSLLDSAANALTTLAIGALLALALAPVVAAVRRRWQWSQPAAVALVAGGVIALLGALVGVMAPIAVDQAQRLSTDLPGTVRNAYDVPLIGGWLESRDAAGWVADAIEELPSSFSDASVASAVDSLMGGALSTLLVVTFAVSLLLDGKRLVDAVERLVPQQMLQRVRYVSDVVYTSAAQYFGGSLTVAALMGIFVLTLCLVFGVPLAPLAALWAMLTDLIPQIGGFLGGALLGLLASTQGPVVFLVVIALFLVYMNIENHFISPIIVGRAIDVTPPTTMIAAFVGGAAAGLPGALVATPLVGAVKRLYMQLRWGQQPPPEHGPSVGDRVRGVLARIRPHRAG